MNFEICFKTNSELLVTSDRHLPLKERSFIIGRFLTQIPQLLYHFKYGHQVEQFLRSILFQLPNLIWSSWDHGTILYGDRPFTRAEDLLRFSLTTGYYPTPTNTGLRVGLPSSEKAIRLQLQRTCNTRLAKRLQRHPEILATTSINGFRKALGYHLRAIHRIEYPGKIDVGPHTVMGLCDLGCQLVHDELLDEQLEPSYNSGLIDGLKRAYGTGSSIILQNITTMPACVGGKDGDERVHHDEESLHRET
uniref:p0 protein n=1 Tax=Beet chlorosis virus TaxID=131082 RepID=B5KL63_9VIRU|nr:P0 protein [Beet chlorosis virus]